MNTDDEDTRAYCVEGCGQLAVAERFEGFAGEDELVDLVCEQCFETALADGVATLWVGADL